MFQRIVQILRIFYKQSLIILLLVLTALMFFVNFPEQKQYHICNQIREIIDTENERTEAPAINNALTKELQEIKQVNILIRQKKYEDAIKQIDKKEKEVRKAAEKEKSAQRASSADYLSRSADMIAVRKELIRIYIQPDFEKYKKEVAENISNQSQLQMLLNAHKHFYSRANTNMATSLK